MESNPSPFLPGTKIQYAWDSTSLGWLKTCPRLYQYSMIEGYRKRGLGLSVHLRFGQLYHSGLEHYDRLVAEGLSHDDAIAATVLDLMHQTWDDDKPWNSDHNAKTRETLIRSVIWYIENFKQDPAQTVILANGQPAVELSFKMELDWGPMQGRDFPETREQGKDVWGQPYLLCGHLDRVVSYAGGTYVMDRKTTSTTISSHYFDGYAPDNQMSLYTLAAKIIYQTPVKGVIIDAAQIAVGFTRYARGFTYRTDAQLEEWLGETKHWLKVAEGYARENHWPMNDKACHQYGGCVFRDVCSKSPEVRQRFLDSDFEKQQWNPLVPR